MIKRPFFSLGRPRLEYQAIGEHGGGVTDISLPGRVSLLVKGCDAGGIGLRPGISVKTGERLVPVLHDPVVDGHFGRSVKVVGENFSR